MPSRKKCPSCRKDWHYNDVVDNHSCCFSCRGLLAECSPSRPCLECEAWAPSKWLEFAGSVKPGVSKEGSVNSPSSSLPLRQKSPKNPRGIRVLDSFSEFLSQTGLPAMPTLVSKPAFDRNANKHTMFSHSLHVNTGVRFSSIVPIGSQDTVKISHRLLQELLHFHV